MKAKVDSIIKIIDSLYFPEQDGRVGKVLSINEGEGLLKTSLYGTWGDFPVFEETDEYIILEK